MDLLRFYSRLLVSVPYLYFKLLRGASKIIKNPQNYTDQQMFDYALGMTRRMQRVFSTTTDYYGLENIPQDGGFIMYSNHQGKYDALGIVLAQPRPISILWDIQSAKQPITRQASKLFKCEVIDNKNLTNPLRPMQRIAQRVQEGRPFLIFPEGGYNNNKNTLQEFQSGCFITSTLSKSTIVPVVIYDSYKSMNGNRIFGKVKTQVHFLPPIPYEEFKHLNRKSLAALVKDRIQQKLDQLNQ